MINQEGSDSPIALKPRALRSGARLRIVSPASAARPERVEAGVQALRAMGYEVDLAAHALTSGPLYYAGTVEQRAADLHEAFADEAVDGIICTRGGWGSAELLPLLDAALIRAHPKPFIGYSDQTSLHLWLQRVVGLVTFHGPMVAADFARRSGVHEASWRSSLEGAQRWRLGEAEGLRVLRAGVAEGPLLGGCLALVVESLGTPYAFEPGRCVLFLEDVGTKPYQWDRMLVHLRYAGVLERASGVVLGDMAQSAPAEEQALLEQAILHALRDFTGPIAVGLRAGHVDGENVTLPLGVRARLELSNARDPRLELLEEAVLV